MCKKIRVRNFGVILFLFFSFQLSAQHEIQVISEETNMPIEGAQVKVFTPKDTITYVTDKNGLFPIKITEGVSRDDCRFEISANGFETYTFKHDGSPTTVCPLTPAYEKMEEVVVTGQIAMTTADKSIHKIRVLDAKTLEAKGAVNLKDALNNELSFRVTQDQMLGSGIQMQGFSGENVKILIDGVPVIGRMNGNVDLSQINLNDIERIEIVEGPMSVNYGSDALAGTINLITKRTARKGFQAMLNSYYETVGVYNVDAKLNYNLKNHRFSVTGMRNFFDGWKAGDPFMEFPKSKLADTNRVQEWKPKEQYQVGGSYTFQYKKFSINPFADFYWEKMTSRGRPIQPDYVRAFDDVFNTKRQNQGIKVNAFFGKSYRLNGVVAHNFYERKKHTYLKDLTNLHMQMTDDPNDQDTTLFRTIMSRSSFMSSSTSQKIDYEVGYDVNFDMASGKRISDSSKTMGDYALFSSMEWKALDGFIIKPAARIAYNSVFTWNILPSLNLKYGIKDWNFRLSYAKGYRAPGMKELYMDFVDTNHDIQGNPDLKPEQSHNVQFWINYHLNIPKGRFDDGIDFELNTYYQNVSDKIELSQDNFGVHYSYFNLQNFESLGGKFNVSYKNNFIQAKIGTSLVNVRTSFDASGFHTTPELTASVMYSLNKVDMNFSVFYKYSGKSVIFIETETGLSQTMMDDYSMLDVNVSKMFWQRRMTVALGAKNLLGVTNIRSTSSESGAHSGSGGMAPIAWGRTMYLKLSFNFDTFKKYQK